MGHQDFENLINVPEQEEKKYFIYFKVTKNINKCLLLEHHAINTKMTLIGRVLLNKHF